MTRLLLTCASLLLVSLPAQSADLESTVSFKSLPTESLTTAKVDGFQSLKGKVVLVDFWASWCEPCKQALPHYNKLFMKYKDQGVVFIGINEDDDIKERDSYLKKNSVAFPMYADTDRKMVKDFKVQAIPTLFVFDRNQQLVATFRGFSDEKIKKLDLKIQELLK